METLAGWIILGVAGYFWWNRRQRKREDQSKAGTASVGSQSDDVLKQGRARLPGKNWECLRCGCEFSLRVDPKSIPRMWWIPQNNDGKAGKSAWTCPDCGNWSKTIPVAD